MMQPPTGAQRPKPDPTQGARPAEPEAPQLSRSDIARMTPQQIVDAQNAGQLDDLMSGRYA